MNDIAKVTGKTTEWLIHGDRSTPDLLGITEHDQVDDGFTEFREYVAKILGELQALRAREQDMQTLVDRQNENLAAQTRILERMQAALGITPPAEDAPRRVRIPGATQPTAADPERRASPGGLRAGKRPPEPRSRDLRPAKSCRELLLCVLACRVVPFPDPLVQPHPPLFLLGGVARLSLPPARWTLLARRPHLSVLAPEGSGPVKGLHRCGDRAQPESVDFAGIRGQRSGCARV
jgi:hypothetical protein